MQKDPDKKYLTSTPLMDQYFQQTYDYLLTLPQKFRYKDGFREPIPKFKPESFRIADFQRIIANNAIKKDNLTKNQLLLLNDPRIKERIEQELKFLRGILQMYRDQ